MSASSKFAVALHAVAVMAYHDHRHTTSDEIADSVCTNPVVIRRILAELVRAGVVHSRRGKTGGVRLARRPTSITLDEVYRAIGAGSLCASAKPGKETCPVAVAMPHIVGDIVGHVDKAAQQSLARYTVADLLKKIPRHHKPD